MALEFLQNLSFVWKWSELLKQELKSWKDAHFPRVSHIFLDESLCMRNVMMRPDQIVKWVLICNYGASESRPSITIRTGGEWVKKKNKEKERMKKNEEK